MRYFMCEQKKQQHNGRSNKNYDNEFICDNEEVEYHGRIAKRYCTSNEGYCHLRTELKILRKRNDKRVCIWKVKERNEGCFNAPRFLPSCRRHMGFRGKVSAWVKDFKFCPYCGDEIDISDLSLIRLNGVDE